MYITLEADYAVRMVDALARSTGRVTAKTLAEKACITRRTALKILYRLSESGVVRPYRGPTGGFELTKPPDEITVYDVLHAIEGPLVLNRCLLESSTCTRVPDKNCPYHTVFNDLSNQICGKLSSISFLDVINATE